MKSENLIQQSYANANIFKAKKNDQNEQVIEKRILFFLKQQQHHQRQKKRRMKKSYNRKPARTHTWSQLDESYSEYKLTVITHEKMIQYDN